MRPLVALLLAASVVSVAATGPAAWAVDAAPAPALSAAQQRSLDKQLADLRASRDPLLKASPLQRIVDIGPAAVEAALPDLMPLLDNADAGLKQNVLNAIKPPVHLSGEQVQRIEKMMADPDEKVRKLARATLEEIRKFRESSASQKGLAQAGQLTAKQLLTALDSEELQTRENAVQVSRKRCESDADYRREASGDLAMLAKLSHSPDAKVRVEALHLMCRCFDNLPVELVDPAAFASEDSEDEVAVGALAALARAVGAGKDAAVTAARKQTTAESPKVQGQALATLAALGAWDDGVAKAVREALDGGNADATKGACAAVFFHRRKLPEVVDRLITLTADPAADPETRAEAMKALSVAAEPARSIPVLEQVLETKTDDKRARIGACTAFMLMAEVATPALTSLQGVAKNERDDLEVRKAAKSAAELIGRH